MQYTRVKWQVWMSSLWLFTWHLVTRLWKRKAAKQPFELEKFCVWRILGFVSMMKYTFLCSCRSVLKDWAPRKKSIDNKHILMVDLSEKKSSCTCWLLITIMLPNQDHLFSINQCHIECIYSLWMHENKETPKHRERFVDKRLEDIKPGKKKTLRSGQPRALGEKRTLRSLNAHLADRASSYTGRETGDRCSRWKRPRPLSQSQRPKYNEGEGTEEGQPGRTQNVEKY